MRALHVLFASACVVSTVSSAVVVGCGGDDSEGGPATPDGGGPDSNVTPPGPGNDGGGSDGGGPIGQGLDPSFGTGGFFTWAHPIAPTQDGYSVIRQADGKLVAAGGAYYRTDYVDVVRFTANGAIDTTFGGAGTGHAIVGGLGSMWDVRLAQAPDGKILVLAITNVGFQAMVARLDVNGVIDTTWGTDGVVRFSAGVDQSYYWGVAVQSDGKVVVAGGQPPDSKAMRFGTDGKPDTTFGNAGTTLMPAGVRLVGGIAIDAMGRIIVSGNSQANGSAIVRLTSAGAIDDAFSGDGVAYIAAPNATANHVAVDAAGNVYVAGYGSGVNGYVAKLDVNGAPDVGFAGGAPVLTNQAARGIAVDSNGRPVVFSQYRVHRYDADGGPDTTLDGDGTLSFSSPSAASGIVLPDTAIVNVGMQFGGVDGAQRMGIAKRTPTGPDDTTFGDAGYTSASFNGARDVAISFEPTADGKTLVIAQTDALSGSHLLRVTSDGKLDTTFGTGGVVPVPFTNFGSLAADATGRALMLLTVNDGFILRRWDVAGNVDSAFGSADGGGTAFDVGSGTQAVTIGTHPDGRVVVAGTRNDEIYVHRIAANGTPDATFGGGLSFVTAAFSATIGRVVGLADGTVIVGAVVDGKPSVVRFAAGGGPAAGFGTNGVAKGTTTVGRVRSVAAQPNGGFVVLATKDENTDAYFIERFGADGKRDTTFATTGVLSSAPALAQGHNGDARNEGPDLAVDAGGKLYVATVATESGHDEMAVFRYTPDGQPDLTWGPNGRRIFTKSIGIDAARGIRIRPDGTLLVGGRMFTQTGASDVALAHIIP